MFWGKISRFLQDPSSMSIISASASWTPLPASSSAFPMSGTGFMCVGMPSSAALVGSDSADSLLSDIRGSIVRIDNGKAVGEDIGLRGNFHAHGQRCDSEMLSYNRLRV